MALKNSTDRGALERLLLSRLPRKEISALVQSYTQPVSYTHLTLPTT